MEHDETSKLADVQTKPADLLVGDLADEPASVVKTTEPAAEPAAELDEPTEPRTKAAEPRTTASKTKNPKRVEQGKKLAKWNKANKRRQLLEPALKQVEATTRPALQQLEATSSISEPALKQLKASSFETKGETKGNTKDYFLIGETILIIGLLSVGLFCYTTSLASTDKATDKATTSGSKKAQLESTQLEAQSSKQLVETQSKDDNVFEM